MEDDLSDGMCDNQSHCQGDNQSQPAFPQQSEIASM
jgi:hypothetical protein